MKKTIYSLAFLLCLTSISALAATAAKTDCGNEDHFPLIDKAALTQVVNNKSAFIIDVNSQESYDKNHIGNAIHYGEHKKDFLAQLPKDKSALIVAYCGGVTCSAWHQAAEIACKNGYTNIQHFKPGISGWVASK
jgi:rhodanese-related sulfurtransferase